MKQIALEMNLMGQISISVNGAEVIWKTKRIGKLWSMLCLLATRGDGWVSIREMSALLWGEKEPDKALNDVKSAISHLRKELSVGTTSTGDDVIEYGKGGYRLGRAIRLTADFVEIGEICHRLESRNSSPDRRLNQCRRLAELYRGPFYSGEDCPAWMGEYAAWLAAAFADNMAATAGVLAGAGRHRDVLALHSLVGGGHPPCDELAMCYYQALQVLGMQDVIIQEFNDTKKDFERRGRERSLFFAEIRRIALLARPQRTEGARLLEKIRADLMPPQHTGAQVLNYARLREVCRQNPGRYAMAIFTLQPSPAAAKDEAALREAMGQLMEVAADCLRGHDIITPYSENQLLIVMPNHSLDSGHQVREHLCSRLDGRLDTRRVAVKTDVAVIEAAG